MKGLSIQPGLALGGLFQVASNFDPFETMGYLQPSLAANAIDTATITTTVNYLTSLDLGTTDGYVMALGDRSGTGAKTLYRIKTTDSTVVDYSNQIDQNVTTGAVVHRGLGFYRNRIIYEQNNTIRSNTATPTGGNDVEILASSATNNYTLVPTVFKQGSDGVLYFNNINGVGKIVLTTGTIGNTQTAFTFTDTHLLAKDICNDGIYTIFIADNNYYQSSLIQGNCRIFFWDTIKSKADIIWDIPDSYVISCHYVDGKIIVMGASGIWVCNSATPPKLVFPLSASQLPLTTNSVTVKGNILYWGDRAVSTKVYGYGAKIGKPILFTPYTSSASDNLHTVIIASGNYFLTAVDTGTNTPKIYLQNSGSTRNQSQAITSTTQLVQPYTLSYIKVVLKTPLSVGQSIAMEIFNGNAGSISASETKDFTTYGAKQSLVFTTKTSANNFKQFEDLYLSIVSIGGAVVQRISVYGIPTDDNSQLI